jgi:chorismate synthase
MLYHRTAGESHGKALLTFIEGFPAGVAIDEAALNAELPRRQGGYGRGDRQKLESDHVDILSGVWRGKTIGSPIAILIPNNDAKIERMEDLAAPRPGHGDLSGAIKYLGSCRGILERASARETTARVAAGALAKQLLIPFAIEVLGYVTAIGPIDVAPRPGTLAQQRLLRNQSELYTLDPSQDSRIKALIDQIREQGDTLGGVIEARVEGVPFGLGSHSQWDAKLDGRLAQAVMSIQAIKGVEIGMGFQAARRPGSEVHDPIQYDPALVDTVSLGFVRPTNHAGGLEAGMTNSQPIVVRAAMKPINTLALPLQSVCLKTKQSQSASYERSDVCAVSAASCVVENVVAFEIARAMVDKFGGDSLAEMQARWKLFHDMAREHVAQQ